MSEIPTIAEASRAIAARKLSPVELTKSCLDRMHKFDDRLHAIVLPTEERALTEAKAAEAAIMAGKLIPYVVVGLVQTTVVMILAQVLFQVPMPESLSGWLALAAAIVVFIILWKVIPTFASLFAALGAELPLPTRMVIKASNFVASYIVFIVAGFFALGYALKRYYASPAVMGGFYRSVHLVCGQTLDLIDADHATGTVYCRAGHEDRDKWIEMSICYFDRYVRSEGRWCFERRDEEHR